MPETNDDSIFSKPELCAIRFEEFKLQQGNCTNFTHDAARCEKN